LIHLSCHGLLDDYVKIGLRLITVSCLALSLAVNPAFGFDDEVFQGGLQTEANNLDKSDSYGQGYLNDFFEGLNLVERHFVEPANEATLLQNAIEKLSFITLPYCQDNLVSMRDCPYEPPRCFSDSIMIVSKRCQYDPDKLSLKALDLLLRDLDPYSTTLDSAMINELKIMASGKFAGVGMVVGFRDGDYVVVAPFDGSPAYRAGIRAGDKLLEIDGTPLHGLSLIEALKMVRGPSGSEVSFRIQDPLSGQTQNIRLIRTLIKAPSVRSKLLNHGVGYLRIVNFQKDTRDEVLKSVNRMKSADRSKLRGLILDLRDNPGGLLTEAIRISDLFLKSGVITSLRSRGSKLNKEFLASGVGPFSSIPIIVLINRGTASASEILTGALKKRPNTLILGTRSFGKASVQNIFPIRTGLALRLTTAHYYTADGRDIEGKGIEPDVFVVDRPDKNRNRGTAMDMNEIGNDPEIKMALEYLVSNKSQHSVNFFMNLF
jgi:carboxyl-terminal processing protease